MDIYRRRANLLIMGFVLPWFLLSAAVLVPNFRAKQQERVVIAEATAVELTAVAQLTADAQGTSDAATATALGNEAATATAFEQVNIDATEQAGLTATTMAVSATATAVEQTRIADRTATAVASEEAATAVAQTAVAGTATKIYELSLTPTPTPTPIPPCIANLNFGPLSQILYAQPALGRTADSKTVRSDSVKLYARLANEPWWYAGTVEGSEAEGWMHEDQLSNIPADCAVIQALDFGRIGRAGSPMLVSTFSSPNDSWTSEGPGWVSTIWRDDYAFLEITDSDEESAGTVVSPRNFPGVGDFILQTAFSRVPFGYRGSFVGVRIAPRESSDTYVEVRSNREDCSISYRIAAAGLLEDREPIPLGTDAGCLEDEPAYLVVAMRHSPGQEKALVDVIYNDRVIEGFEIDDPQSLYHNVDLQLVVNQATAFFDYVVVLDESVQ